MRHGNGRQLTRGVCDHYHARGSNTGSEGERVCTVLGCLQAYLHLREHASPRLVLLPHSADARGVCDNTIICKQPEEGLRCELNRNG